MNRRQALTAFTAALGAVGVSADAFAEPMVLDNPDPKRVIAVFRAKQPISYEAAERIKRTWEQVIKGTDWEGTRAIVLDGDLSLDIERR